MSLNIPVCGLSFQILFPGNAHFCISVKGLLFEVVGFQILSRGLDEKSRMACEFLSRASYWFH